MSRRSRTMTDDRVLPVRRALIAVADKAGLEELGRAPGRPRRRASSPRGPRRSVLAEAGVPVTPVADVTGFPEMLEGRVKTLHPAIHGGILADKRKPEHLDQLDEHDIEPFDLVVVNLYPFRETVASGADPDEVIEQIDIGGPALVRAAAKNFESVAVIVEPRPATASRPRRDRRERRDRAGPPGGGWPARRSSTWRRTTRPSPRGSGAAARPARGVAAAPDRLHALARATSLRYGENPHQRAALYAAEGSRRPVRRRRGPRRARRCRSTTGWTPRRRGPWSARSTARPAAVIVKHNNPCGVAVAPTLAEAYAPGLRGRHGLGVRRDRRVQRRRWTTDAAQAMRGVFTEVVIAPAYARGALAAFGERTEPARAAGAAAPTGGPRGPPDRRRRAGPGRRPRRGDAGRDAGGHVTRPAHRGPVARTSCSPGRWPRG